MDEEDSDATTGDSDLYVVVCVRPHHYVCHVS